ncbi:hypothetical protein IEQ34_019725 [Dendrobium chrysotoxum]|uniref:Uncharacterized protein n=1 Tax=Dendrobium chrysotoxum TaxID=161865 RepID=A0AAV7G7S8_DENCH|nr:hypothetical protein IEQ34_019725 [Dendrobium chrysotoxum]
MFRGDVLSEYCNAINLKPPRSHRLPSLFLLLVFVLGTLRPWSRNQLAAGGEGGYAGRRRAPLFSDPSAGVVPVCSVGLTVWSRIWGKCNLGQATVSVKPFSYRKFLFGVFSFSEISFSSHSLTVLRGHFLFHDHHGHQDSIFPEVICVQFQFACQVLGVLYQKYEPVWYGSG